jgi:hypothetical protein
VTRKCCRISRKGSRKIILGLLQDEQKRKKDEQKRLQDEQNRLQDEQNRLQDEKYKPLAG